MSRPILLILRMLCYVAGIFSVSIGIVCCVRCGLGISPISSVPYVLSIALPFTLGQLTLAFHLVNTAVQYAIERRLFNIKLLLQIPVAIMFGTLVDFVSSVIVVVPDNLLEASALLVVSIVATALGMVLMVNMELVQNPPDGTVRCLSRLFKVPMGRVKVVYDIGCVVVSFALGMLLEQQILGFGIATILSALFVGRVFTPLQSVIGTRIKRLTEYKVVPHNA